MLVNPDATLPRVNTAYPFIARPHDLSGKLVLITGCGKGIGRATALEFAASGADLALVSRTQADLTELEAAIGALEPLDPRVGKGRVCAVPALDVSQPGAAAGAVALVKEQMGRDVDVLVNCAAITALDSIEACGEDDWWRIMEVNLRGPVAFAKAVLPDMVRNGGGHIVSLTSATGVVKFPYTSAYNVSKTSLIRFHSSLALETAHQGIVSLCVNPGLVQTEITSAKYINFATAASTPGFAALLQAGAGAKYDDVSLPARTVVSLVGEDGARKLNGKYIDATEDLEKVIAGAERIAEERLYELRVMQL